MIHCAECNKCKQILQYLSAQINLKFVGTTISNTGVITIPPGTAANSYAINYMICQNANPGNCSIASVYYRNRSLGLMLRMITFSANPINTLTGGDTAARFE
jgi:hypothetical protein